MIRPSVVPFFSALFPAARFAMPVFMLYRSIAIPPLPIGIQFLQQESQRFLLFLAEAGKHLLMALISALHRFFGALSARFGQADIHRPAVIFSGCPANQSGMLQFCQHFTGRARLNIQASGQTLLRGLSLFCQDDEDAALAAFTLRDKAQHMPKFPQVDDQFVIGIRRMIMCQSLPSEVFFPVRMLMPLGNPSRAQIFPASFAIGRTQVTMPPTAWAYIFLCPTFDALFHFY